MSKIPGYRRDNGLYLGKFEDKKDAIAYIEKLASKYKNTPNPRKMSLRYLQRFAKNEGVEVHLNQLSQWFKDMNITIRNVRPKPKYKKQLNVSVDKEVVKYLKDYPNQSYMAELGLKLLMRIPTEDIVLFFPTEEHEEPINIIFKKDDNKIKAIATGKLNERDKAMISGLVRKAEKQGMKHIIDYARLFGFKWYGGINEEDNDTS